MNASRIKNFFYVAVYLSLGFLGYYLYANNYLIIPEITNYGTLAASLLLLFTGTIFQSLAWSSGLKSNGISITKKSAIASTGLSVFMKYIPGKVLSVMGRSAYISSEYEQSLAKTSALSFYIQLLVIWTGIMTGGYFLLLNASQPILYFGVFALCVLSLFLYFPNATQSILNKVSSIFNKELSVPFVSRKYIVYSVPYIVINWLCFGTGFYFLATTIGLTPNSDLIFLFPVATSLAIFTIIAPGGLGIREGLLVAGLLSLGYTETDSTTLATISRLWFLIGEVFLFLLANIIELRK